jgi:hypothetical protein
MFDATQPARTPIKRPLQYARLEPHAPAGPARAFFSLVAMRMAGHGVNALAPAAVVGGEIVPASCWRAASRRRRVWARWG